MLVKRNGVRKGTEKSAERCAAFSSTEWESKDVTL